MERILKIGILFFFVLFLAMPVLAQEGQDATAAPVEDLGLVSEADEGVVTGEVVSVDKDSKAITIKADDAQQVFSIVDGETILWKGIEDIEISDIKAGEEAEVGYYTDGEGNRVASWVDVLIEEEMAPLEEGMMEGAEEGASAGNM